MPWELLSFQIGAHYREERQFRRFALRALQKVAAVYPMPRCGQFDEPPTRCLAA